jgi:hypothetical protein
VLTVYGPAGPLAATELSVLHALTLAGDLGRRRGVVSGRSRHCVDLGVGRLPA